VEEVLFERRFRGPPNSANGGYSAGVAAGLLGAPASARLLRPPPLEKPLAVERTDDAVRLLDGDVAVIEARPFALDVDLPAPVRVEEASAASERYVGFKEHPFASCFVCGPERTEGDGLRIFPGRVGDGDVLAAVWTPGADLAGADGRVRPEVVWAALDCPGGWAGIGGLERPAVLGTLAARQIGIVEPGRTYVAMGWATGFEGRKNFVGSALFTAEGEPVAEAAATWIMFKT
jgi:hypothetical protein